MTVMTSDYTHRDWREHMDAAVGVLGVDLGDNLDLLIASLGSVGAGREQTKLTKEAAAIVKDLAGQGAAIHAYVNDQYKDLATAQQDAGGLLEVAKQKRYNTRDS